MSTPWTNIGMSGMVSYTSMASSDIGNKNELLSECSKKASLDYEILNNMLCNRNLEEIGKQVSLIFKSIDKYIEVFSKIDADNIKNFLGRGAKNINELKEGMAEQGMKEMSRSQDVFTTHFSAILGDPKSVMPRGPREWFKQVKKTGQSGSPAELVGALQKFWENAKAVQQLVDEQVARTSKFIGSPLLDVNSAAVEQMKSELEKNNRLNLTFKATSQIGEIETCSVLIDAKGLGREFEDNLGIKAAADAQLHRASSTFTLLVSHTQMEQGLLGPEADLLRQVVEPLSIDQQRIAYASLSDSYADAAGKYRGLIAFHLAGKVSRTEQGLAELRDFVREKLEQSSKTAPLLLKEFNETLNPQKAKKKPVPEKILDKLSDLLTADEMKTSNSTQPAQALRKQLQKKIAAARSSSPQILDELENIARLAETASRVAEEQYNLLSPRVPKHGQALLAIDAQPSGTQADFAEPSTAAALRVQGVIQTDDGVAIGTTAGDGTFEERDLNQKVVGRFRSDRYGRWHPCTVAENQAAAKAKAQPPVTPKHKPPPHKQLSTTLDAARAALQQSDAVVQGKQPAYEYMSAMAIHGCAKVMVDKLDKHAQDLERESKKHPTEASEAMHHLRLESNEVMQALRTRSAWVKQAGLLATASKLRSAPSAQALGWWIGSGYPCAVEQTAENIELAAPASSAVMPTIKQQQLQPPGRCQDFLNSYKITLNAGQQNPAVLYLHVHTDKPANAQGATVLAAHLKIAEQHWHGHEYALKHGGIKIVRENVSPELLQTLLSMVPARHAAN